MRWGPLLSQLPVLGLPSAHPRCCWLQQRAAGTCTTATACMHHSLHSLPMVAAAAAWPVLCSCKQHMLHQLLFRAEGSQPGFPCAGAHSWNGSKHIWVRVCVSWEGGGAWRRPVRGPVPSWGATSSLTKWSSRRVFESLFPFSSVSCQ